MASFKLLSSGKIQARVRVKGVADATRSFLNREDAEAWAKITEAEVIRGIYIRRTDAERMTLREALTRYQNQITPHKRGRLVENTRIEMWKRVPLAGKSLASIRPADFAEWRDKRLETASSGTVRRELGLISNLFNIALREWSITGISNPIESIRLPSESIPRDRIFLPGEESMLYAAMELGERHPDGRWTTNCRNIYLRELVSLALETGMRRGELLALRWENVRLEERVAHLPLTKAGTSRDVPLSSKAIQLLKTLDNRGIYGEVFVGISPNAVRLAFSRTVKRGRATYVANGGTDPRFLTNLRFHDLRHIAITRLADKLPNIIELAAVSGHSDVRMLKRYYHPKAEHLALKLG
jgi:integrase